MYFYNIRGNCILRVYYMDFIIDEIIMYENEYCFDNMYFDVFLFIFLLFFNL